MSRRAIRKLINAVALGLSGLATAIGLFFLGAILWTLIRNGLARDVGTADFTAMTPPPGGSGGLLNAIYGSVVMTVIGILIGRKADRSVLAGTYLAEYGRTARISTVIRFVNDVLLSAPSIIVGLFVYELLVVSAWDIFRRSPARRGARGHRNAGDGPHHRGHAESRTAGHEGRLDRDGCIPLAHHHQRCLPRRAQRHRHGTPSGGGPHQRGDRAAAVHRAQQSVLEQRSRLRRWPICRW